jgi:hypothetical protein
MEVTKVVNVASEFEPSKIKTELDFINRRIRKKCNYKKISNEIRQKLIEMVYLNDCLLKDAAGILNINYSTAKTILRIFRIEKRILKKNAEEEKELKNLVMKFKDGDRGMKMFEIIQTNSDESSTCERKTFKEEKVDSINERLNKAQENNYFHKFSNEFTQNIVQMVNDVNICFNDIQNNQLLINNLIKDSNNMMGVMSQITHQSKIYY